MTENVPPSTSANATATADQPGRPYYESLRTTLRQTIDKKRKLDDQLAAIEDQIYKTEGAYLEETANSGNIIKGFDGWVKGVQVGQKAADDRRRGRFKEDERLFSRSSVSWIRVRWPGSLSRGACRTDLRPGAGRTGFKHAVCRPYTNCFDRTAVVCEKQRGRRVQRELERRKQEEATNGER